MNVHRHEDGKVHVVALSGGKDSTAMALRLAEVEPRPYAYVCTPTADEPEDMIAHWLKLGAMLGSPVLPVMHPLGLNGLIEKQRALPNWRQRWCTRILKIEPFREWLGRHSPAVSYVGLRADEEERIGGVYGDIAGVEMRFPFREWGWGEEDVWDYLAAREVTIPERTDCRRCFFQRLHEWHALWQDDRVTYEHAAFQERATGFTFRSPGRDTWPASLDLLAKEFEAGRVPKRRADAMRGLQCRACSL